MERKVKEIGLYIHIPFCVSKCIYCDFLSGPSDYETRKVYVDALCNEIQAFAEKYSTEYIVKTVFFGGGTPSVLENDLMEKILKLINEKFVFKETCEFTIECNPGTVKYEQLCMFRDYGVNRLSFGLQSADNIELKKLGRIHTFEDFLLSYEYSKKAGFSNVNADVMSGLMNQTVDSYVNTLKKLMPLELTHISAYSLIIEEGTPLHGMHQQGTIVLPDEDSERKMYYETGRVLENYGYYRYEISNYSKKGYECRHNIIYWQRGDYKGFGLGAASLKGDVRYANVSDMKDYISGVAPSAEVLTKEDCMGEFVFLGLRMMRGIDTEEFKRIFDKDYFSVFSEATEKHLTKGLLVREGNKIKLTEKGIDVSNYVFSDFLLT